MSNNITFVTHLRYDNPDRINNLQIMIDYYSQNFPESKFIFIEDDYEHNKNFDKVKWKKGSTSYYFLKNTGTYHRTKALNYGFNEAKTPIVVSMDTDCIVSNKSILECEQKLLNGVTAAWPYNGYFIDVDYNLKNFFTQNSLDYNILLSNLDGRLELPICANYKNYSVRCTSTVHLGVGGIVMFNKELFLKIGGYNENFVGWGCEDNEVEYRLKTLNRLYYRDKDKSSICFHLYHAQAQRAENPFYDRNGKLLNEIQRMDESQLLKHILTWKHDNV